jgi:hypothetical protein
MEVKKMRKILAILVALALMMPAAFAVDTGTGIGITVTTEQFKPMIWLCGDRVVLDDNVEPGRISDPGDTLVERTQNYAFEGEQIAWNVLVLDKNGFEKIKDVYVSVGSEQGSGESIEANCQLDEVLTADNHDEHHDRLDEDCNARIDEEVLTNPLAGSMATYVCTLTVETPETMHGQYWVTANVVDLDDQTANFAENEFWFFNPTVSLTLGGLPLNFGTVRPGTQAYSNTITVGNGAEDGSGVMMDMFISGTDFYDPAHSGAKCPSTNQLSLDAFDYYAVNGAYGTQEDERSDEEGYVPIGYGIGFNNPNPFYGSHNGDEYGYEVIQSDMDVDGYFMGNVLSPGAEMSVTFRLSLPLPCNGDFNSGHIYFWGEAI